MEIIKLQTSDGVIFPIDVEIIKCSNTIKTMLDLEIKEDDEEELIPLTCIHSTVLTKIIQWANHHKNDPPYVEKEETTIRRTDNISPWDADFFKMDVVLLCEIIQAANYLDIKPILETACKTIANMIKDRTPEEIRKVFNIENDFTPEEEEEVRIENEWCELK